MFKMLTLQIALLALFNGIMDIGRLMGFGLGDQEPMLYFSATGFALLGGFAIARIVSSVGMWINSNWGTSLLFGTTLIELVIFLFLSGVLDIGIVGFVSRLIQLTGAAFLLVNMFYNWQKSIHD